MSLEGLGNGHASESDVPASLRAGVQEVDVEIETLRRRSEDLQREVLVLRAQLDQERQRSRRLEKDMAAREEEMEQYEAELNDFRRQLEADRRKLDEELDQLQARKQELTEAIRQAELEMSRERAHLAREKAALTRLREEIRMELERAQRLAQVRDQLGAVEKLRRSAAVENPSAANGGFADKLRQFWQKLSQE
ncbi:MAG: hypothetical protein C4297_07925 [Gemmataceae bacterium]